MTYDLPRERAHPEELQVMIAAHGGDSSGLTNADAIALPDIGACLVRTNRSLQQRFTLLWGTTDEAYRDGFVPLHAVKHLLANLQVFNPEPAKREARTVFDGSATQDDLKRMGYNPIGLHGNGAHVRD